MVNTTNTIVLLAAGINYEAFAIPAFFIFLLLEYLLAVRKKQTGVFKYESSISNLSIGIAERLLNLFITASFYSLYVWIYTNYALFNIPNSWWVWILLILVTDLVWYWYHRLGHQINFFWAAHIVHHQSEEFNFTVAARITVFQALIRNIFWCAIPFLGFHPNMVITILMVHGAYSFFTHTQLIGKLGWLEHIMITPSLHGIHHASDEKYLDKNFGDVFTFWDRIFGTFQKEEEAPKYGLTHPIKSYSFLWQHFHYYLEIIEACKQTKSFKGRLKIIFGNPGLLNQEIRPALEKRYFQDRSPDQYRFKFRKYLNIQLIFSILLLTFITAGYAYLGLDDKLFMTTMILLTLINCGALMEQKKWIYYLECSRILTLLAFLLWKAGEIELIILPVLLLIIFDEVFNIKNIYNNYVLRYEEI
ncbi:sterol desaturase family protein [Pedobacter sp. AW31-3R]|uniref:sterol desaturase family protein n=1 Tax=Pedobacter sp. AW31-3R TaxID=3445781 RepID=UPI003F9F907B